MSLMPSHSFFSRRPSAWLLALAFAISLAACGRHEAPAAHLAKSASADITAGAAPQSAPLPMALPSAPVAVSPLNETPQPQRHIAVRHELQVEVPPAQLPAAWAQVRDLCGTLRCEVLSASLRRESPSQASGAVLEMRVAPDDADRLLGAVSGAGQVISHDTESEDKTAAVIDVEAHIKNRTEFRDSLRAMLADRSTKRDLSDMLEIQRTLADTQAELDSRATQLKTLMQLTQMQRVRIDFVPERSIATRSGDNPIARAWHEAGQVLAFSVAVLINFVAAALPWLVVGVPVLWALTALLGRWRRRRARKMGA